MPFGQPARPGSMGKPLPGVNLTVEDGELVLTDPSTDPTFFVGYLDGDPAPADRPWHTGDRVDADADGYLYFVGRSDDVIISAGYRIGPFEVESALVSHPAVAEAAVVAAPDEERGAVVRAVVVLRDGFAPSDDLAGELQDHVKRETAPYKYPRIVEFAKDLPKTASGKVRRASLRAPVATVSSRSRWRASRRRAVAPPHSRSDASTPCIPGSVVVDRAEERVAAGFDASTLTVAVEPGEIAPS